MAELIDKWEVVNKLIQLQNDYNFYEKVWDADVLYHRIVELEIGIGKTPGLEVGQCKDCESFCPCNNESYICSDWGSWTDPDGWCYKGRWGSNDRRTAEQAD